MVVVPFRSPEKKRPSVLELPAVSAPSPLDPKQSVDLEISSSTIQKFAKVGRKTPIFEAWAHLVGEMPPINNAMYLPSQRPAARLGILKNAHACFKGVRRPYGDQDRGSEIYVYVISTSHTIRWVSAMDCVADLVDAPGGKLLTVQVCHSSSLQPSVESVWATITKWEFVDACAEQPRFPDAHKERYDELLWHIEP